MGIVPMAVAAGGLGVVFIPVAMSLRGLIRHAVAVLGMRGFVGVMAVVAAAMIVMAAGMIAVVVMTRLAVAVIIVDFGGLPCAMAVIVMGRGLGGVMGGVMPMAGALGRRIAPCER